MKNKFDCGNLTRAFKITLPIFLFIMTVLSAALSAQGKNAGRDKHDVNWFPVIEKRVAYVPVLLSYFSQSLQEI